MIRWDTPLHVNYHWNQRVLANDSEIVLTTKYLN